MASFFISRRQAETIKVIIRELTFATEDRRQVGRRESKIMLDTAIDVAQPGDVEMTSVGVHVGGLDVVLPR
jgi:hypothetical protein